MKKKNDLWHHDILFQIHYTKVYNVENILLLLSNETYVITFSNISQSDDRNRF